MLRNKILIALALSVVCCNAQLISFKDGKIGVNFLGYHASAGLGGLLTGNSADGGLSASAGTPHGQNAAAGLGGILGNGRAAGGLYANAQAAKGIEARAGLGGVTGEDELRGIIYSGARAVRQQEADEKVEVVAKAEETETTPKTVIQKVKPPKKFIPEPQPLLYVEKRFGFDAGASSTEIPVTTAAPSTEAPVVVQPTNPVYGYRKVVNFRPYYGVAEPAPVEDIPPLDDQSFYQPLPFAFRKNFFVRRFRPVYYRKSFVPVDAPAQTESRIGTNVETQGSAGIGTVYQTTVQKDVGAQRTLFDSIFNIPISTLRAVNDLLNTKATLNSGVTVRKDVHYA